MNERMGINVVPFVNARRQRKEQILKPIIVKMIMVTFMVTLAMILVYSDMKWVGYTIYGKEVVEFIMFIRYVVKRGKHGTVQH